MTGSPWPGHAVAQIPVPLFEPFVRARWANYDATLLGAAGFCHAHVTVLGPVDPGSATQEALSRLAAVTPIFEARVVDVRVFPDGVIYGALDPVEPFARMTVRLSEHLGVAPYGGAFAPEPHVTLDAVGPGVTVASIRDEVEQWLGVSWRVDELVLAWYRAGETRTLRQWGMGAGHPSSAGSA